MYEDLEQIAQLKLGKEMESISAQTLGNVEEMQREYAARAPFPGMRDGPHEAAVGQVYIDGAERLVRALYQIWADLIQQRKGHISRPDIAFITGKIDGYADSQRGHLHKVFSQRSVGAGLNVLTQRPEMRMHAVAADIRRDLEIMAREYEAFPNKPVLEKEHRMTPIPKRRFSPGRRVLVGNQSKPGTVVSEDDQPGEMGEFRHVVTLDRDGQSIPVYGCDLQGFPGMDDDLPQGRLSTVHLHIENSSVANLNLGSQVGAINASLTSISEEQGASQQELVLALKQLTEATIAETALRDTERQEVVQALSTLAEQAAKKPEERSGGPVRAVIAWLPTAVASAAHLTALWEKVGPTIKAYFRI
jgi:hypothetical protein